MKFHYGDMVVVESIGSEDEFYNGLRCFIVGRASIESGKYFVTPIETYNKIFPEWCFHEDNLKLITK